MKACVIIGTGGLAKEIWGMLRDSDIEVLGFVSDWLDIAERFCGLDVLGNDDWFVREAALDCFIANGTPDTRRKIHQFYQTSPHRFPKFIHRQAIVFGDSVIGGGSVVMPGGVMQHNVKIGRFTHVNMGVTIGHDVTIGDYCVINHNAGISGDVTIGHGVLIGAGATIIEGHTIGDGAIVGAGAVVTKDIPANQTWIGVPASPMGVKYGS